MFPVLVLNKCHVFACFNKTSASRSGVPVFPQQTLQRESRDQGGYWELQRFLLSQPGSSGQCWSRYYKWAAKVPENVLKSRALKKKVFLCLVFSQLGHGVEGQHHGQVSSLHGAEQERGSAQAVPWNHRRHRKDLWLNRQ